MTTIRLLLMLCAAFLGTLQASSSAIAHASLIRSDPADGSVLAQAPERFVLMFNEPVSPLVLRLVEGNGTGTALDKVKQAAESLDIEAPGHLGPGTHVLSWRVVSEDGHPISGAIVFSVGAPSMTPSGGVGEVPDWPVRIAIWGARFGLYVGLFFGIGGAVFRAWIGYGSRYGQGFALAAIVAGLLSILPAVGLQGVDALGGSFTNLAETHVWLTSLKTTFGVTAVLAGLALLLGLASVRMEGKPSRVLSAAAALGAGSALAASGHASTAPPQWLTRPTLFVHVTAVSIWAGALVPLAFLLASRTPAALVALRSFSKAMPFVIGPLVAAGFVLAFVQVKDPGALFGTAYGCILAGKLALVFVLFSLAGINRWFLTGPAGRSDPGATRLLKRSTLTETILVAAILGVVALWRFTPPPRTLSAVQPLAIHIRADKAAAEIKITSGQPGGASASISITTSDGRELEAKELTLTLSNQAGGIEPIRRTATKPAYGPWQVHGIAIPVAGRWTVRLDVMVSDFDVVSLDDIIDVTR